MQNRVDPALLALLACPKDELTLSEDGARLACPDGHSYPVVDGIPVLLRDDVPQTIGLAHASLAAAQRVAAGDTTGAPYFVETLGISDEQRQALLAAKDSAVDPVAAFLVGATNGHLYGGMVGRLKRYPIPELRVRAKPGAWFLDVGCSWGRWSIAAARSGFEAFGVDPSLGAVLAAKRVARDNGVNIRCVVGDARFLPFRAGTFEQVFSYSVLQHFHPADAKAALEQMGRVLRSGGNAFVQMPNRLGLRCLYHQARRGFRQPREFEVRYWAIRDLLAAFESSIGPAEVSIDGFFGLGLQPSDAQLMDLRGRAVLRASETLRAASKKVPVLRAVADSVYVSADRALR